MRLLNLWLIWVIVSVGPALLPETLYEPQFHFLQGTAAFLLILAVLASYRVWWAKAFSIVALLQIALNAYDAIIPISLDGYNMSQTTLNCIEILLLFVAGGYTEIRNNWNVQRIRGDGRPAGGGASGCEGARG